MPRPYRVTVVCLGNICRSPIGEAVIRGRVVAAGLADRVLIDSAGTGDWHVGHDADPRARRVLTDHGYALDHRARQIGVRDLAGIDLLLAMDEANFADLRAMTAQLGPDGPELRMLRSFDPALAGLAEPSGDLAVPDPYYGSADDFAEVLAMVQRAADGLVAALPQRLHR